MEAPKTPCLDLRIFSDFSRIFQSKQDKVIDHYVSKEFCKRGWCAFKSTKLPEFLSGLNLSVNIRLMLGGREMMMRKGA